MHMKDQLAALRRAAEERIAGAADSAALDAVRIAYLGKKGGLTAILKQMGSLPAEERPVIGQLANEHKFWASVGVYVGLQFALQTIAVTATFAIIRWVNIPPWLNNFGEWLMTNTNNYAVIHIFLLCILAISLLLCYVMFLIIRHLLTKRLNLA